MNDIMQSMYRSSPSVLARILDAYGMADDAIASYNQLMVERGCLSSLPLARDMFNLYLSGIVDMQRDYRSAMQTCLVLSTYKLLKRGDVGAVELWDIMARLKIDKDHRRFFVF